MTEIIYGLSIIDQNVAGTRVCPWHLPAHPSERKDSRQGRPSSASGARKRFRLAYSAINFEVTTNEGLALRYGLPESDRDAGQ